MVGLRSRDIENGLIGRVDVRESIAAIAVCHDGYSDSDQVSLDAVKTCANDIGVMLERCGDRAGEL